MKLKKMLSLLAAAAMAITALTVSITASAETVATGECGGSVNWMLDSDGVLTLSGEGAMGESQVVSYTHWSYSEYADQIKEVIVEEGITQIGGCAFGGGDTEWSCSYPSLTKVNLPSTLKEIGKGAFKLVNIQEINIPDSVEKIGQDAFRGSGLKKIDFHDGMLIGGYAFYDCASLKEVTVPKELIYGINYSNPPGPNAMFSDCKSLEKVVIEGAGVVYNRFGVVTNCGLPESMFWGCSGLKTVVIKGNCEYISQTTLGGCSSLTDIYLYNTDLSTITAKGKGSYFDSIDTTNNPTFHVIKDSTTEQTLRDAGYLTDENTEYLPDTSALEAAITEAEAIDTSKYTDETVSALATAVENGKALLGNENATQDEVDQAVTAVKDAISALKEKVEEPTDEPPTDEPPTDEPPTDEPTEPETQEPTTEPADVTVSVIPDKAYAMPGDEVTYTIHVDTKKVPLYTVQMRLVIPEGMTYVENSGAIVDGVQAKLGYDNVAWTEQTLIINGYASAPNAVDSFDLATFKCKVDEGVADATELGVDLTYLEFTEEGFAKIANVAVAAGVVTVGEDPNPTEPSTEPTSDDTTQAPTNGGSATTPTDKPADNNNNNSNNNNNNNNNGGANGTGTSATDKPVNTGAPAAVGLSAFLATAAIGIVAMKKRNR